MNYDCFVGIPVGVFEFPRQALEHLLFDPHTRCFLLQTLQIRVQLVYLDLLLELGLEVYVSLCPQTGEKVRLRHRRGYVERRLRLLQAPVPAYVPRVQHRRQLLNGNVVDNDGARVLGDVAVRVLVVLFALPVHVVLH